MLYADASVIVAAYLGDEPDHARWHALLFEGTDPVVVSEVVRVEIASAVSGAARAGRLSHGPVLIARFEADCAAGGPIKLLALRSGVVVDRAVRLVQEYRLRALDALHLAVAIEDARPLAGADAFVFATRDRYQADAAMALGFQVA